MGIRAGIGLLLPIACYLRTDPAWLYPVILATTGSIGAATSVPKGRRLRQELHMARRNALLTAQRTGVDVPSNLRTYFNLQ
jgi:hypothetical protein